MTDSDIEEVFVPKRKRIKKKTSRTPTLKTEDDEEEVQQLHDEEDISNINQIQQKQQNQWNKEANQEFGESQQSKQEEEELEQNEEAQENAENQEEEEEDLDYDQNPHQSQRSESGLSQCISFSQSQRRRNINYYSDDNNENNDAFLQMQSQRSESGSIVGSQVLPNGVRVQVFMDYDPKLAEELEEKKQDELKAQMKNLRVKATYEKYAGIANTLRKQEMTIMRKKVQNGNVFRYLEQKIKEQTNHPLYFSTPFVQVKCKSLKSVKLSLKEHHAILLANYSNDLESNRIQCMLYEKATFLRNPHHYQGVTHSNSENSNNDNHNNNNNNINNITRQNTFIRLHVKLNYGSFERLPSASERANHIQIMWKLAYECYPHQTQQPDTCAWIATTNPKLKYANNNNTGSHNNHNNNDNDEDNVCKLPMLRFVLHMIWPNVLCSSATELLTFWKTLNNRICAEDPFFSNCVDFASLNLVKNSVTLRNVFAYKVTLCPECRVIQNGVQPRPLADYESSHEDYNSEDEQRQLQRYNNSNARICLRGCDKGKLVDESTIIKPVVRVYYAHKPSEENISGEEKREEEKQNDEQHNEQKEATEEEEHKKEKETLQFELASNLVNKFSTYDIISAMSLVATEEQWLNYCKNPVLQHKHDFVTPLDAPDIHDKQYPNAASSSQTFGYGDDRLRILYDQEIRIIPEIVKGKKKERLHPNDNPALFLFCTRMIRQTGDGEAYRHLAAAQICIDYASHIAFVNVTGKNSRVCFLRNHAQEPIYFLFRPYQNMILTQCTSPVCRRILKLQAEIDNYELKKRQRRGPNQVLVKPTEEPTQEDSETMERYMRFVVTSESNNREALWNMVGLTYSGPRPQTFHLPETKQRCDENGTSASNFFEKLYYDSETGMYIPVELCDKSLAERMDYLRDKTDKMQPNEMGLTHRIRYVAEQPVEEADYVKVANEFANRFQQRQDLTVREIFEFFQQKRKMRLQ